VFVALVSKEEQEVQNNEWLEDCCIRLLCVLALDRFGDFVGDQVVAIVRETCAQVLGTLVTHMSKPSICTAFDMLLQLQSASKWEARHGSLLGLKYVIAVRKDLVDEILPKALVSIVRGLVFKCSNSCFTLN
jgi:TATA-binding protein-associated factor